MKLRDARRFCAFLLRNRILPVDYWKEISRLDPIITWFGDHYRIKIKNFVRRNRCAFVLFRLAYQHFSGHCFFQKQCLSFTTMSNPLSDAVEAEVRRKAAPTIVVDGFRPFKPQPLPLLTEPHPHVKAVLDHVRDAKPVEGYVHSSTVREVERMASGFTKLIEKPARPYDPEVAWELFVDVALQMPVEDGGVLHSEDVPEITAVELAAQMQTSSGAGLVPVNPMMGRVIGSKHEMHTASVNVNIEDKLSDMVPPLLPYKPALKDEVIKDGKDPRVILLESQPNYMVLKHVFGTTLDAVDPCSGIAIGLSGRGGDFKVIPFTWWVKLGIPYSEFLEWAKTTICHESDKTSWEASTNATDGLVYVLSLLMRVNIHPSDMSIVARAIADYINPAIAFGDNRCYFAPWRVPSGSYLTSHGNSVRHRLMARYVVNFFAKHGSAGSDFCACAICQVGKTKALPEWGRSITEQELLLLDSCFVQGDDYIGISVAPHVFDFVIDHVFGTTTKTVVAPLLGTPEEPGVEFLRRCFTLDGDRFAVFRKQDRVLAKLYNGSHRATKERFAAALDCIMREVGQNPGLFRTLYHLRHDVVFGDEVELDQRKYRDALDRYARRVPGITDYQYGYVPPYNVLCNMDASDLRPLKMVKDYAAVSLWGVSPVEYLA